MSNEIISLRQLLHAHPERSGEEARTKALILDFLRTHTSLELLPCGDGFYAAHREDCTSKPAIALRADYDALPTPNGSAAHLCGHDGHAAALCGVALCLEGHTFGRNIFLLFQPAEETGQGAKTCLSLFEREKIGEIYGAHNLPGYPLGTLYTRPGTFACASMGLTISLLGAPAHAAYPEYGISPADAVGKLLCALPTIAEPSQYSGMTLCTVIGAQMGEKAFGSAASQAEIWLTLRAEHDRDLAALQTSILKTAQGLARDARLTFSHQVQDAFPATENEPQCAQRVLSLPGAELLEVPMRWSEDFGHYLQRCPGAYFGIGAGEHCPALHTEHYEYPDALLQPTVNAFLQLITCEP